MNQELQSPTIGKLAAALVAAQATMGVAVKDTVNGHFKTKYADLASVINAAREPLAANGLAVVQRAHPNDRGVHLQTMIVHSSGEWMADGGLHLPAAKADPQGFGSAMTYARRYGYAAMLGIVQDDDDGAAAVASQQAARMVAALPKVTAEQAEIVARLAVHARPTLDIATKTADALALAADQYPATITTVLGACVKAKRMLQEDADNLRSLLASDSLTPAQLTDALADVEAGIAA